MTGARSALFRPAGRTLSESIYESLSETTEAIRVNHGRRRRIGVWVAVKFVLPALASGPARLCVAPAQRAGVAPRRAGTTLRAARHRRPPASVGASDLKPGLI